MGTSLKFIGAGRLGNWEAIKLIAHRKTSPQRHRGHRAFLGRILTQKTQIKFSFYLKKHILKTHKICGNLCRSVSYYFFSKRFTDGLFIF